MDAQTAEMEARNHASGGRITPAIFKKVNLPVTLKFEDLVYKIKIEKGGFLRKPEKAEEKVILKGITGTVQPGEMLAMLGPSGSGKTTLLTALGGRLGGHLTGTITYNGKPFTNATKRNTGFVTQDDILYPHLTVTETLVYTAFLRLPRTSTRQEKAQYAEAVLTQLGLERCRDSIVGGPGLRGVSGGERKRVSIGQEMLLNPSLLLLDEPTSGLDSTTALKIVSMLSELAGGGRTIVMAIHQPSSRLFYMIQKVLLLSEGNPLYFGTGSGAMEYFSGIGFAPSVAMNPADFILDLANGVSTADSHEDQAAVKQSLVSAYKTHLLETLKSELGNENTLHLSVNDKKFRRWSNSWWEQFSVLLMRGIKERKHESFSILNIAEILIISILSGLLWWKSSINRLQDQVGIFFFYSSFWGFNPLYQAIFTFPQERTMFEKERSSGMYRLSSYFMALTLGDLPMVLTLPTIFYTITYWMAGLKPTAGSFFSGLLVLLYSVLCTQGLGLAIGAVVMDIKKAVTLASVVMMTSILAGGYYVQHVPAFIGWIRYVSISQYTYKLLLLSQYRHGETYLCESGRACLVGDSPAIKAIGLDGLAVSVIALTVMMVGYRLVAYIALMRIGVAK